MGSQRNLSNPAREKTHYCAFNCRVMQCLGRSRSRKAEYRRELECSSSFKLSLSTSSASAVLDDRARNISGDRKTKKAVQVGRACSEESPVGWESPARWPWSSSEAVRSEMEGRILQTITKEKRGRVGDLGVTKV